MTRTKFILLLTIPPLLAGYYFREIFPEEIIPFIIPFFIIIYFPLVYLLRMRYVGMTWKEVGKSFIPFYGIKNRFKTFQKKSDPETRKEE